VPVSRWSHSELAAALVRSGAVASIATSTVWRWLDAERIKPWQHHLWQRPIDPLFVERARVVLALYQRAEALVERGVWVVCADEKTSIQARERIHPVDPAIPGHPARVASRYTRQGALQLFAGLSVSDGKSYGYCRARRCFVDFQAFFLEVLAKEALRRKAEEVRLILDNGSTHAP
jgi:hypothetical protein